MALRLFLGLFVAAFCAIGSSAPQAQTAPAPAPEDITAGLRIYRQKADCQACHGWAADGRKMDSQMPDGANRRNLRKFEQPLDPAADAGVAQASADLLPLVYERLRALAGRKMRRERSDQTLQATSLVHEAYLRLVGA